MYAIATLIDYAVTFYIYILIANAILSWLVAFNVVSPQNNFVRQVGYFLWRVTEPVLAPIRRLLPDLGGIDISPVILIVLLIVLRNLILVDVLGYGRM
ncbi:MAG: YggT family protein [Minwuia sp.]|uniref:YggT family protein n=1 Tax=Minwuia sp. TaxID=2493630 RepID=UPI003A8636F1